MGRGFAWLIRARMNPYWKLQLSSKPSKTSKLESGLLGRNFYRMGYITREQLIELAQPLKKMLWPIPIALGKCLRKTQRTVQP